MAPISRDLRALDLVRSTQALAYGYATRASYAFRIAMPRPGRRLLTIAVLSLLALSACTIDRTYLPALLADPMADYEAEGIDLVDAWEEGEGHNIIMDMPTHADVWRKYRIEDQTKVETLLADAVAYAEAHGWRIEQGSSGVIWDGYRGAKEMELGMARLVVSTGPFDVLDDPDGPKGLTIHLDFGPVRFDEDTTTTSAP